MLIIQSLAVGVILNDENKRYCTSWVRYGSLLASSDYTVILSYQDLESQNNFNYGLEFSYDFQNGWEFHGSANHNNSAVENATQYLIGVEYISTNICLITEFYHQIDDFLTLYINNYPGLLNKWQWHVSEIFNLNDSGKILEGGLKYLINNNFEISLIIDSFSGLSTSKITQNPNDWEAKIKLRVIF